MKKIRNVLILFFLIFCFCTPVYASSDYYKDITISFNHNGCDDQVGKDITIQLFKDGVIEGDPVVLNKSNNYTHTYEDLLIFGPESPDEIKYSVKVLENGNYRLLNPKHQTHLTERIQKWAQVLPENIQDGHTYVFTTDNWNYEQNGFRKVIYLRGDVTAKGAAVLPEYNIINVIQSYYIIDGEPIENTKWVASKVPTTDPNYNEYKDYFMFTNEENKKLTLTAYLNGDNVNWIYKRSSKSGWVNDNELNTNRVTLTPVPLSKGRFYIGTYSLLDQPNNAPQYITLSGQNQYQAGNNIDRAAQFKAYEYIDTYVEVGEAVTIEESMCPMPDDEVVIDKDSKYKRNISINFKCDGCESKKEEGITLQLFADGKKVTDGQITLNNKNGFNYVYEDLPIFADGTLKEINYEVKALIAGKYYDIASKDINYKKETIKKWMQISPTDIKAGHTYVFVTENLYQDINRASKYMYLLGNVQSKAAAIETEYNIVDGNKSFYTLKDAPATNTKWTASSVPTDDEDYNSYKNYLMFTNESEDKKLTLTAYINGDNINWIYKRSGNNGWVNSNELNTNRVLITPVKNDEYNRFYIGTYSLLDEPDNNTQYLTLDQNNNYIANPNQNEASKFMAYEYVDKEITVRSEIVIESSLCEVLTYPDIDNPNTGNDYMYIISGILAAGVISYLLVTRKKSYIS